MGNFRIIYLGACQTRNVSSAEPLLTTSALQECVWWGNHRFNSSFLKRLTYISTYLLFGSVWRQYI